MRYTGVSGRNNLNRSSVLDIWSPFTTGEEIQNSFTLTQFLIGYIVGVVRA